MAAAALSSLFPPFISARSKSVIPQSPFLSPLSSIPRSRRPIPSLRSISPISAVQFEAKITRNPSKPPPFLPFRVGHGFDLHCLEPGLPLIIGGVDIPHDRGCEAHSDGDVLLHCVVDAILGALGLPDIGQIFPDSDPKWKGAASSVFMREAVKLMREAGHELGNLDATLILQRPKLSPHKEAIRANLCDLLEQTPPPPQTPQPSSPSPSSSFLLLLPYPEHPANLHTRDEIAQTLT